MPHPKSKHKPLKADFHIHTAEDPLDRVPYTAQELILKAADDGFEVLAITNHHCRTFDQKLFSFARDLGILLIPGMETTIQERHVLVLNPPANVTFSDFSSLGSSPLFPGAPFFKRISEEEPSFFPCPGILPFLFLPYQFQPPGPYAVPIFRIAYAGKFGLPFPGTVGDYLLTHLCSKGCGIGFFGHTPGQSGSGFTAPFFAPDGKHHGTVFGQEDAGAKISPLR
jgi:hypothetical protein